MRRFHWFALFSLLALALVVGGLVAEPSETIVAESPADVDAVDADPTSIADALPGLAIPEVIEAGGCCIFECEQAYMECFSACKAAGGTAITCAPACFEERDLCAANC